VLDTEEPFVAKRPVGARIACVLDDRSERPGMQLEIHPSRAVRAGEIRELALTCDPSVGPGLLVDRVAYVGFAEIVRGGVIHAGDEVTLREHHLGELVGLDHTHFPNHMNILARGTAYRPGAAWA
jgi:hypothetical protein